MGTLFAIRVKPASSSLIRIGILTLCGAVAEAQTGLDSQRLNPASHPPSTTLFTELSPDATGISAVNSYDDPRMWGEHYQEMVFGTIGTGVAVGDYDRDGRPDVFLPGKTGGSKLYRNLGDWRFEDVTEASALLPEEPSWGDRIIGLFSEEEEDGEAWDQGAAFADVNNDGWLDLYVTSFAAPNRLYINQADGTFLEEGEQRGLAVVDASGVAAFCDYDRDGWLDVYLQTNMLNAIEEPEGRRDLLFRNTGDGRFLDVTDEAGIAGKTSGHSATWWDYNEDGWPDLYVANDFGVSDSLYRNSGDGTFADVIGEVVTSQPFYAMGADLGDIDNDGRFDLFVGDMAPTSHEKDQRGMAISRARELPNYAHESTPQRMRNALYLNTGHGRTLEIAEMAGVARSDWTWSVRFEDLDCDGLLDLHVTNGMVREYHNVDILDKIMAAMSRTAQRGIMKASPVMEESNLAFRNDGNYRFQRVEEEWGLAQIGVSFGAGFGDFDGDGDLDIVHANYGKAPTLLRNDGTTGNRAVFELRGVESNSFGAGAIVRVETEKRAQSRQLVLARGYLSTSEPALFFGLGDEETMERVTVTWPNGRTQVFKDLASGYRYTVTEPSESNAALVERAVSRLFADPIELQTAARPVSDSDASTGNLGAQPAPVPFRFNSGFADVVLLDCDGDGADDAVFGGAGSVAYIRGTSEDFSGSPTLILEEGSDGPMVSGDFDGDGDLDLLVAGRDGSRLLLRNGDSIEDFEEMAVQSPHLVLTASAGDFNRDGVPDLFLGSGPLKEMYPKSGRSRLLAGSVNGLSDVSQLLPKEGELGLIAASRWLDYDGDGWVDLAIAQHWGPVRLFRNLEGQGFEDVSVSLGLESGGKGLWHSLAVGDFNGDGAADIVVGNLGLNTPYRASVAEPAILLFGDFGGRSRGQLVEGYWESGELFPLRSRKELGALIPPVLRRFSSNNDYASATLSEVLGEDAIARASRYEATQLQSGVFLSQNDGSYVFSPFPRLAQVSPLRDIAVGDFDGDGNLDLAATQNLYSVDPVIGRFDGGLGQILLGDGKGGFEAIAVESSGFVVDDEGGGLLSFDSDGDGDLDILAARLGEPPLFFRNRKIER